MKHPIQPAYEDDKGVLRFKPNKVVLLMLEILREKCVDLNILHNRGYELPRDEWDQFNQLIGYSVHNAPLSDYGIATAAERAFNGDKTPDEEKGLAAIQQLEELRNQLAEPLSDLFCVHPDDLRGEGE